MVPELPSTQGYLISGSLPSSSRYLLNSFEKDGQVSVLHEYFNKYFLYTWSKILKSGTIAFTQLTMHLGYFIVAFIFIQFHNVS